MRKWTTEPKKFARQGDVLLSVRAPVGATNFAPVDCSVGRGLAALRAERGVDQDFLFAFLRHSEIALAAMGTGTTFAAITGKQLLSFPMPVPPLPEQRRIVAAIEEHFSRLDAAEADLRVALGRTTTLMQSTLITLIPCVVVPNGWDVTTVDEAGATDLGRQRAPKYHSGESMRPYLRVANVFEDRLDLADVMEMDFGASAWARVQRWRRHSPQ